MTTADFFQRAMKKEREIPYVDRIEECFVWNSNYQPFSKIRATEVGLHLV